MYTRAIALSIIELKTATFHCGGGVNGGECAVRRSPNANVRRNAATNVRENGKNRRGGHKTDIHNISLFDCRPRQRSYVVENNGFAFNGQNTVLAFHGMKIMAS